MPEYYCNEDFFLNIPTDLRRRRQWVAWSWRIRNDKRTKVPTNSAGHSVDASNPSKQERFSLALEVYELGLADGIGYSFHDDDGMVGIDLDNCRDPRTGEIDARAQAILEQFQDSYAEVSPSGTGVKIIVFGKKTSDRCRNQDFPGIEIYSGKGRFFTVTGERLPGHPAKISNCQEPLAALMAAMFPAKPAPAVTSPVSPAELPSDDWAIIDRIRQSRQGAKFDALWGGDTSAYNGDHSAADFALVGILAYWTGPDAGRIDALFRQSGLFREKWDKQHGRQTYGARTIENALAGRAEFYDWGRSKPACKCSSADHHQDEPVDEPDTAAVGGDLDLSPVGNVAHSLKRSQLQILCATNSPRIFNPCRKMMVAQTSVSDGRQKRFAFYPCRCRTCPVCAPVWLDEHTNWYTAALLYCFPEVFIVVSTSKQQEAAIKRQVERKGGLYVRAPQDDATTLFITSIAVKGAEPFTITDDVNQQLREIFVKVPLGQRLTASAAIRFCREQNLEKLWKRDIVQPPVDKKPYEVAEIMRAFVSTSGRMLSDVYIRSDYKHVDQLALFYTEPDDWTEDDRKELRGTLNPRWYECHDVIISSRKAGPCTFFKSNKGIFLDDRARNGQAV